ncbi:tRNA (guanine(46)-N(7))-methyltransferase TrmB [Alteromonas sp. a30]|uniref:tRNA (guanine(46)-N(7))-methyltransferase TrmB n=1 Tax=Alteromonas sp. a30 TaxID=2730917 RepID=UPI002281D27D|nr:SAM-dependent methyltransferase [Alteromonas sp. a30]MCY7295620.1 SAM-dependent methyltransferase [Alteromonas sp. a30]
MQGNSRSVTSNQTGPHEKLAELVEKYLSRPFQKPISEHTRMAFNNVKQWLGDDFFESEQPLILDSCCGVGESTQRIAALYPEARVIGLDKSLVRTSKQDKVLTLPSNAIILRADVIDFWRLAVEEGWKLAAHFLLFPNPYPKSSQVQRRWHASPSFSDILKLGGELEVRSNWSTYIDEFSIALSIAGAKPQTQLINVRDPFTAFERKYHLSGQSIWQLKANLIDLSI